MAVLSIRRFGDPTLNERSLPVKEIDRRVGKLIKNLAEIMYDAPGIGLAAPQIGVLKRAFVFDIGEGLVSYINPEIVWRSKKMEEEEEGCLSVPDIKVSIKRSEKIKVRALTPEGKKVEFKAEGLLARVIQHEVDHLDGVLVLDRTSKAERRKALQQLSGFAQTVPQKESFR